MEEIWKAIPGFCGYEVSNLGIVRSIDRDVFHPLAGSHHRKGKVLTRTAHNRSGYVSVEMSGRRMKVARLVLMAFVGPPPDGYVACHNDGNRINDNLSNLRWDTQRHNNDDKITHGTAQIGVKHGMARLTEADVFAIRASDKKGVTLSLIYHVDQSLISAIKRRKVWKHI